MTEGGPARATLIYAMRVYENAFLSCAWGTRAPWRGFCFWSCSGSPLLAVRIAQESRSTTRREPRMASRRLAIQQHLSPPSLDARARPRGARSPACLAARVSRAVDALDVAQAASQRR